MQHCARRNSVAIPGLGKYFVTSVQTNDYTVIAGVIIFFGALLQILIADEPNPRRSRAACFARCRPGRQTSSDVGAADRA